MGNRINMFTNTNTIMELPHIVITILNPTLNEPSEPIY